MKIKQGYLVRLEKETQRNSDYRRVLYTGLHTQLVLMALRPGEQIGEETHAGTDQFFRVEAGEGTVTINHIAHRVKNGSGFIVPAGALHNVANTGKNDLKLYTLYSPPKHRDQVHFATKAQAEAIPEHFNGKTSE